MTKSKKSIVYNDLWATGSAGFLIPLFSVRSEKSLGIGDIGDLYPLIDWAAAHGQKIIQLLPLNDTSPGDASPYAAISAFAANPLYIDIDRVPDVQASTSAQLLLKEWSADGTLDMIRESGRVDYKAVRAVKMGLLAQGFSHFFSQEWEPGSERADELLIFAETEKKWLLDYAVFRVLKERFHDAEWRQWPESFRVRDLKEVQRFEQENHERLLFYNWLQWLFMQQWNEVRAYAHSKGVYLMGDVAFYPGVDSVDVWANPGLFQMDDDYSLSATSGAPPDYFNPDGQDWGTPLYDWHSMELDDFSWWCQRVERVCAFFDLYRLDHFRGFEAYWQVPAGVKASEGSWVKAPGEKLLHRLLMISLHDKLLIPLAEDLGDITPQVHRLRRQLGIAGYKTFLYGWGEGEASGKASGYRYPEDYDSDFLATTGTHDTPTLSQWFKSLPDDEKRALLRYLTLPDDADFEKIREAIFAKLYHSKSLFVVLPFQDILGLGPTERINVPGTFGAHNWTWRMPVTIEALAADGSDYGAACSYLSKISHASGRSGAAVKPTRPEIVGTIPSRGAVQRRKKGEFFTLWAAVRGRSKGVVVHSALAGDEPLKMFPASELSNGITLYHGEMEARYTGTFSLTLDLVEKDGGARLDDCLIVTDQY